MIVSYCYTIGHFYSHVMYVYIAYSDELLLNLSVNPDCQNNPDLCPCIQVDNNCNVLGMVNNKY